MTAAPKQSNGWAEGWLRTLFGVIVAAWTGWVSVILFDVHGRLIRIETQMSSHIEWDTQGPGSRTATLPAAPTPVSAPRAAGPSGGGGGVVGASGNRQFWARTDLKRASSSDLIAEPGPRA